MKLTIITLLFSLFALDAWAAGYQLRYQGAETMGTSFASQGTYGNSISSIYFNPALFLKQDKKQAIGVEGLVLYPTSLEFTSVGGNTVDDFASTTISGSLFWGYKFDDKSAVTVAFTTPWGTDTEYPENWDGQFAAIKTQLRTFNLQPVYSRMVGEQWAFSVGPQIQLAEGTLSSRIPPGTTGNPAIDTGILELDGDHWGLGAVLAVTYMPTDNITVNLTYNSQVKHDLEGEVTITNSAAPFVFESPATAEIFTPDTINLGASHVYGKWVSHFNFSWTNWSLFDEFDVENAPGNPAVGEVPFDVPAVAQNWQDTYFVAIGATYINNEKWTFRGGLSYETSAVENEDRTPRTQDADRLGVGLGASYKVAEAFNLDFGFNQIIYLGDVEITNPAIGGPQALGEFDNAASLFRVGLEYVF